MARQMFVKVYDDLEDHPRWQQIERLPECVGLWTLALSYCHRNHTDGHFPARMTDRRWGGSLEAVAELVTTGRWHAPGHECAACPQPEDGHLYLHDYLEHQRSRAEVEELTKVRAASGRRGGVAKASGKQSASNPLADSGKPEADTDTDTDTKVVARKRAQQLPDDFRPTDRHEALAADLGVNLRAEWPQFVDHHRAKGSTMKDWGAALNTWIRNAAKFSRSKPLPSADAPLPPPPSGDMFGNFRVVQ